MQNIFKKSFSFLILQPLQDWLRNLTGLLSHCLTIQGLVEAGFLELSQALSASLRLSILTHSTALLCSPIPQSLLHCEGKQSHSIINPYGNKQLLENFATLRARLNLLCTSPCTMQRSWEDSYNQWILKMISVTITSTA